MLKTTPETTPGTTLTLQDRQKSLVNRIFNPADNEAKRSRKLVNGLEIYRNNLDATATRALTITYPVLYKMLGEDACQLLAKRLIRAESMSTGDWGDWGGSLSSLIATTPLAISYPFLQDVAELEWLIHQCQRSPVEVFNQAALSTIHEGDFLQAKITLPECIGLMESRYPVGDIWLAHQASDSEEAHNQAILAKAIADHSGTSYLIIHRGDEYKPFTAISEQEYLWLKDVAELYTIGELLDKYPTFNFIDWLPKAIKNNWIVGLSSVDTPE